MTTSASEDKDGEGGEEPGFREEDLLRDGETEADNVTAANLQRQAGRGAPGHRRRRPGGGANCCCGTLKNKYTGLLTAHP